MVFKRGMWIAFYILMFPFDMLFTVVAKLLSPVLPLFASSDGWLPNWLKWFQTFDANLDTGVTDNKFPHTYRYIDRVRWLFRNSGYGFSYYALGCRYFPGEWTLVKWTYHTFYAVSADGHFCLIYTFNNRVWVKLGWKASNMFDPSEGWSQRPWGPEWRIPIVFSTNLFKYPR